MVRDYNRIALTGDLTLTPDATTTLDILYSPTANQADLLAIHGHFSAHGTLTILLSSPPLTPDPTPFTLLSADTFQGTFLNAPDGSRLADSLNQGTYLVTYSPTSLVLSDYQPLPIPEPLSALILSPALLLLTRRRHRPWAPPSTPPHPL